MVKYTICPTVVLPQKTICHVKIKWSNDIILPLHAVLFTEFHSFCSYTDAKMIT